MKCPKCNHENTLTFCEVYQKTKEYKILRNGKISKKVSNTYTCLDDWDFIVCDNCGFQVTSNQLQSYSKTADGKIVFDEDYYD